MPSAWAASLGRYNSFSVTGGPSGSSGLGFVACGAGVVAGSGGGGEGEEGVAGGAPASASPLQVGERDDRLVALVLAEGVLAAFPVPAGCVEGAHGGGVVAALGGEMTSVAEHVRPPPQRLEVL